MESIAFYVFGVLSVIGAILVVSSKNPVSSALALVLTLFSTAVLFILLLAQFIAVIQVLVYAGAIMVLFLFTVMFLDLREEALRFDARNVPIKMGILVLILIVSGYFATMGFKKAFIGAPMPHSEAFGTVQGVGEVLFRSYLLPFELTSILIVVAILGVVTIAKRRLD
ncbi:MAG: NADH-quinone oxidoreductase subunit J [Candidatus Dadabacteria bacterium]